MKSLIIKLIPKKNINNIRTKLNYLNKNIYKNEYNYFLVKIIILILCFIIVWKESSIGYILSPVLTIIFYIFYDYIFLDISIKKRSKILEKDAIFFFKVLSLTLQNESNLKLCFELTCNSINSELSNIIESSLEETKYGKSLTEALNDAKNKISSKDVANVLFNIIESNKYGNSIIDLLDNQIDYLTDKRILNIKGQINKLPTKISIVSVVFFIPLIMLLILGPVIINYFIK